MIEAMVLDFDGLIVDTETAYIDCWSELHAEHGLACCRDDAHAVVGHVGAGFDPWAAFGRDVDRASLEQQCRERSRARTAAQPILPGVQELLLAAREAGLVLGVASNSSRSYVEAHLERLKLRPYFTAVRCFDDVPRGKPEPDVYLAVMKALNAAPAASIAFEDSVPGHLAAKQAGLHCVVVPNPSTAHCEFLRADVILPSLAHTSCVQLCERFSSAGR